MRGRGGKEMERGGERRKDEKVLTGFKLNLMSCFTWYSAIVAGCWIRPL